MARKKLNSPALAKLSKRVNGLQAIDMNLILKNGLAVESGLNIQNQLQEAVNDYNIALSLVDEKRHKIRLLEKEASHYSKSAFDSVKSQFGDDSLEYEKVGGKRMSMRLKTGKKGKKKVDKTT